jgi:RIO kinase 1
MCVCVGCLSTGKEANVYYARGSEGREYAIKIFKTSILVFKDRDKYVSGEFRFRNGYCKSNPRKMVKTWAEKEMRNLRRLNAAGISAPVPHLLKSHVLIMDFLGNEGWCAPRIRDANLTNTELVACYKSIAIDMRRLFADCNLVHGDLSEYNLLWHNGRCVVIDVSQSVEQSHPFASDFLRKDVSNVTEFFAKRSVHVLSKMQLFHFITDKKDGIECEDKQGNSPKYVDALTDRLEALLKDEEDREANRDEEKLAVEEAVFMQTYIPTSLNEISNPYAESERIAGGNREKAFADAVKSMIGGDKMESSDSDGESSDSDMEELLQQLRGPSVTFQKLANSDEPNHSSSDVEGHQRKGSGDGDSRGDDSDENSDSDSDEEDDSGDDDDSDEDDEEGADEDKKLRKKKKKEKYRRTLPSRDNAEDRLKEKELRKESKKNAKEAKAEKRKNKIPKHVKKRAMKQGRKA